MYNATMYVGAVIEILSPISKGNCKTHKYQDSIVDCFLDVRDTNPPGLV